MNEINLHHGNQGRPMAYRYGATRGYRNRSTRVAANCFIAATWVATAAATGPVGLRLTMMELKKLLTYLPLPIKAGTRFSDPRGMQGYCCQHVATSEILALRPTEN